MLQLESRLAAQAQDKFAESRAVGGAYFAPVQPVPFPSHVQPPYYTNSCAEHRV